MIRSRLFWKSAAALVVVILIAAIGVILVATPGVTREAMDQVEHSLLARAQLLREQARPVLAGVPDATAEQALHARLGALGEETGTRLTVIDAGGRVIADSMGRQATMESPHEDRPEVAAARRTNDRGTITRHSATTGLDLRYLALVVRDDAGVLVGYVRTALPTTFIEARRRQIRNRTAVGAGIAALVGLAVGLFLTHRLTRRLASMADAAGAIADGRDPADLPTRARDETGDLALALASMHEQLVERHRALARERNELAGILTSMHEGVIAVDRDQRIVQMNDVARTMLGAGDQAPLGRDLVEISRIAEVCEVLETVVADDAQVTREIRLPGAASTRVLQLHASPLQDAGDVPRGAVLVLHDVTELRRLEAVRRDFAANVSHELKTPLAAIQGLLETVLDDDDMDDATEHGFLGRALAQTERLTTLVKDLLALAHMESESNLLERTRLDVRGPLREAADRLEPIARRGKLRLQVDLPDEPLAIQGDEEGLRQIADNLLDNAGKYTAEGGRIDLLARREGDEVVIEVADTGIGIGSEHLGRIFERFYRVDKARSRSLGGTGLGLAIVRHLAEAHGGRVEVESTPGGGSTFRVRLPLANGGPGNGAPRA